MAGVSAFHILVSQTSSRSAFRLLAFLARKAGSEGEPVSSSPSNSTRDVAGQAAVRLEGAAGLQEGHQLALVVGRAAPDDALAPRRRLQPRLEGRARPQLQRDRRAARRNGRRTAHAARRGSWPWPRPSPSAAPRSASLRASKPRSASRATSQSAARSQSGKCSGCAETEGMRTSSNRRSSAPCALASMVASTSSRVAIGAPNGGFLGLLLAGGAEASSSRAQPLDRPGYRLVSRPIATRSPASGRAARISGSCRSPSSAVPARRTPTAEP